MVNKRAQATDATHTGGRRQEESLELLRSIEQHYTLCDQTAVLRFLGKHPRLVPVLQGLAALIPDHFPVSPLFLRIVDTGSAIDQPDGRLVLFIATETGFEEAMNRKERLMTAWLPDVRRGTGEPFSIGVAFGATTAAVEAATQEFMQRHGDGYLAHGELAARFLQATSPAEQAMARAELAAHLARAKGRPLSAHGGDVSVVLARLRRYADAHDHE